MTAASDIAAKIKLRIDAQRLVSLTNDDPDAGQSPSSVVNDTKLIAACEDAIGEMRITSGVEPAADNASHIATIVPGVLYFLELYKSRDTAIITFHKNQFYAKCKGMRETLRILPSTLNPLKASRERGGTLPDMDRQRPVFSEPNTSFVNNNYLGDT